MILPCPRPSSRLGCHLPVQNGFEAPGIQSLGACGWASGCLERAAGAPSSDGGPLSFTSRFSGSACPGRQACGLGAWVSREEAFGARMRSGLACDPIRPRGRRLWTPSHLPGALHDFLTSWRAAKIIPFRRCRNRSRACGISWLAKKGKGQESSMTGRVRVTGGETQRARRPPEGAQDGLPSRPSLPEPPHVSGGCKRAPAE